MFEQHSCQSPYLLAVHVIQPEALMIFASFNRCLNCLTTGPAHYGRKLTVEVEVP